MALLLMQSSRLQGAPHGRFEVPPVLTPRARPRADGCEGRVRRRDLEAAPIMFLVASSVGFARADRVRRHAREALGDVARPVDVPRPRGAQRYGEAPRLLELAAVAADAEELEPVLVEGAVRHRCVSTRYQLSAPC